MNYSSPPAGTPLLLLTGTLAAGAPAQNITVSPASVSGNQATFTFPSLQDGRYKATLIDNTVTTLRFNVQHADAISAGISTESVDFVDFSFFSFSFGASAAGTTAVPSSADFNGDGEVNFIDFSFFSFKFGDSLAGFNLPPVPSASSTAAFAVDAVFEALDEESESKVEQESFYENLMARFF